MENYIFETESGYKLGNGNAESEQEFSSYEEALEASITDSDIYKHCEDEFEAQEQSVIDWV